MDSLLGFAQLIIELLLNAIVWVIVAYAVLSWLIGFHVINMRNSFVYRAVNLLDSVVSPMLRPFRRILPSMGGLDFSPLILIILIEALLGGPDGRDLGYPAPIPALFAWLHSLLGGGLPN